MRSIVDINKDKTELKRKFDAGEIESREEYDEQMDTLNDELVAAKVAEAGQNAPNPAEDVLAKQYREKMQHDSFVKANELAILIHGDMAKLDENFQGKNRHLTHNILQLLGKRLGNITESEAAAILTDDKKMKEHMDAIHKEHYNGEVKNPPESEKPAKKVEPRDGDKDAVEKSKIGNEDGGKSADPEGVNEKQAKAMERFITGEFGDEDDNYNWNEILKLDEAHGKDIPVTPTTEQGDANQ